MKPNYRLPDDDHLVVQKVERTTPEAQAHACFAALLAREWSVMGRRDRVEAIKTARAFGEEFAKTHQDEANYKSYVETCVVWALDEKVINDVEFYLWTRPTPKMLLDRRVAAFARGCEAYRAKKRRKAS